MKNNCTSVNSRFEINVLDSQLVPSQPARDCVPCRSRQLLRVGTSDRGSISDYDWDSEFLRLVCNVREGFALDPPELCPEQMEAWLARRHYTSRWLDELRGMEEDITNVATTFLESNPRAVASEQAMLGPERISQRIFANRFRNRLDLNRAVARHVGSRDHLRGFLIQPDVHGKHPLLSPQKQKEWLRLSNIPESEWVCEPGLELAFMSRILFAAPSLWKCWQQACRKSESLPRNSMIPLVNGMLLHELLRDNNRLTIWLGEHCANHGFMKHSILSESFRSMLRQLADNVIAVLQAEGLDATSGMLESEDLSQVLDRLCDSFEYAELWYMCMELYYRCGPEDILDSILLICPDPEDEIEE